MESAQAVNFDNSQMTNQDSFDQRQPFPANIKLLTSLSNLEEVALALQAGVDIIDLKNPNHGALGALQIDEIKHIVQFVAGKSPVSATIGDLSAIDSITSAIRYTKQTGVDIIKIGFFQETNIQALVKAVKPYTKTQKIIAVLFADGLHDFSILPALQAAGFYGVMLDTANKNGRHLLDYFDGEMLDAFVTQSKQLNLETGLAGALRETHVEILSNLQPNYLGFRSALCENSQRTNKLDINKVIRIKNLLHLCNKLSVAMP